MMSLAEFDHAQQIAKHDEGMKELLDKLETYYYLKAPELVQPVNTTSRPSRASTIYDTSITSYWMNDKGQWIQKR